jgi:hypothetical protein
LFCIGFLGTGLIAEANARTGIPRHE